MGSAQRRRGAAPGHGGSAPRRRRGRRVLFVQVAQLALAPGSHLAATRWVAERVAIADCPRFRDDSAYAAMDFLLDTLGEIAASIFDSLAHPLNLAATSSSSTPLPLLGGRQRRRAGRPAARPGRR